MADDSKAPDPAASARARARTAALAWASLGLLGAFSGFVTLSAAASLVAQNYREDLGALAVLGIAGTLAVIIPLLLGNGIVKLVTSRGYQPYRRPIYATAVALVNVIYVALLQFSGPQPVQKLWLERGTWLFDALTQQGPYGPAAIPVVNRSLAELGGSYRLREAAPLWCDESAAAFGVGLSAGLAKDGPATLSATLATVTERYGAKLDGLPESSVEGRKMLGAVTDVVLATFPDLAVAPIEPAEASLSAVSRRRVSLSAVGWEARYEDGEWRWCPGTADEVRARGEAHAAHLREEVRRVPTPNAVAAGPWDADVRLALQAAVAGRSAWLSGAASVLDRRWADALTRAASAVQGERLRAWCARASSADQMKVEAHEAFATKWGLPRAGLKLTTAQRGLLEAQGRQYLAELVELCRGTVGDRVSREASLGLDIPEEQRRRWVEGEARAFARDARLSADGDDVKVEFDGVTLQAVLEDGQWRINWTE